MRDKFLTEAMGEQCWWLCYECETQSREKTCECGRWASYNFSTWQGFGKLWEWAQKQEWWDAFWFGFGGSHYFENKKIKSGVLALINPDRFANDIYAFLKDRA